MTRSWKLVVLAAFLSSCAGQQKEDSRAPASSQPGAAQTEGTTSVSADEAAPEVDTDGERRRVGVEDLVRTNNQFAFDLFKSVPPGNVFVSPHAIASTVAVAYTGAAGDTAEQIRTTLRLDMSEKDLHQKSAQLHEELRKRETLRGRGATRGFRLRVVNGVWHDEDVDPTSRFLRIAHNKHFAEIASADFEGASEASRAAINKFVGDATAGKIGDVIAPGRLGGLTRLVMVNAAHFDAPWQVPFSRSQTKLRDFATPSGTRTVSMMELGERFAYLRGEGFSLVELPYAGGDVVATVIVPDSDIEAFGAGIDEGYFQWMVSQARQTNVYVSLPKFEIRYGQSLVPTLSGMGMAVAFDPSKADFSGIEALDPARRLYLDDVLHETWVSVDEDGTDAAAGSAPIGLSGTPGAPSGLVQFAADKPFLFIVRDVPTGAILFLGRVIDP